MGNLLCLSIVLATVLLVLAAFLVLAALLVLAAFLAARLLAGSSLSLGALLGRHGVADLLEGIDESLLRSLVGIILHGHRLRFHIGGDLLHALDEAQAVLDLLLAILAVHLRIGGHHKGLDVLGQCQSHAEHNAQHEGQNSFHCCLLFVVVFVVVFVLNRSLSPECRTHASAQSSMVPVVEEKLTPMRRTVRLSAA